jgi:hypothetical protein
MSRRLTGILFAATLQAAAVVLAHELTFLARYGSSYGEALVHAGHDGTWTAAATTSLGLAAVLAVAGVLRLARLGLLVRRAEARALPRGRLQARSLLGSWLRLGGRTAALTVVILTVQENLEHAAAAQGTPGAAILLTPEYAGGLWIAIGVGLAVALVASLYAWRRQGLLQRLRSARPAIRGRIRRSGPRPGMLAPLPLQSILGRCSALRAPPLGSLSG